MSGSDGQDIVAALAKLRHQAISGNIRVTRHAFTEMIARGIILDELVEAAGTSEVLENYPDHQRGPCCLLHGTTAANRDLHMVCTTGQPVLIIITAYEPHLPKWKNPRERNR